MHGSLRKITKNTLKSKICYIYISQMYAFGPGILKILQHFQGKHLPGNKGGLDLCEFHAGRLEHVYILYYIMGKKTVISPSVGTCR